MSGLPEKVVHDPLIERIEQVRAQARKLAWRYVLMTILAVAIGIWALLAGIDYFLRPEFPAWRFVQSLLWAAAVIGTCVELVRRVADTRLDRHGVVRRLEGAFPELQSWLEAAVEFLVSDPRQLPSSSPSLRQQVIQRARQISAGIDFTRVLRTRPSRKRTLWGMGALLLLAALTIIAPSVVLRSWQRVLMPAHELPWPRMHRLALVELPSEVAAGSDLVVRVADRQGRLPGRVRLEYRPAEGGGERIRYLAMRRDGEVMQARITGLSHSLQLRAVGGDDTHMKWRTVRVVPPRRLPAATVTLHWPDYTGWGPTQTRPDHLQVLPGTRIICTGRLQGEVSSAALCFRPLGGERKRPVRRPLRLQDKRFDLPEGQALHIEQSGSYWVEWKDNDGRGIYRTAVWRVTVHSDQPPELQWADDSSGPPVVARSARIAMEIDVREDVGVGQVEVLYRAANRPEDDWQATSLPIAAGQAEKSWTGVDRGGQRHRLEGEWMLAERMPREVDEWVYKVRVTDLAEQMGETSVRHLRLADHEQLERSWRDQLAALVEQLRRLVKTQQQAADQVETVLAGPEATDAARQTIASVHPLQQQIQRELIGGSPAALQRLRQLRQSAAESPPEWSDDLAHAQQHLEQTAYEQLPRIDQLLRTLEETKPAAGDPRWTDLNRAQLDALRNLTTALERIEARYDFQSLVADLTDLRGQQSELTDQLQQLQTQWLQQLSQGDPKSIDSRREQLGDRQRQLAWQVQRWGERLEQLGGQPQSLSVMQELFIEALQTWDTASPSMPMRESAWQLDNGHIGQAVQLQPEIQHRLAQLDHRLRPQSGSDSSSATAAETAGEPAENRPSLLAELEAIVQAQLELQGQTRQANSGRREHLADAQRQLAGRTLELPADATGGPAVNWSLKRAAEWMEAAAGMMVGRQAVAQIDRAQQLAIESLDAVRLAVDQKSARAGAAQPPPPTATSADSAAPADQDRFVELAVILNLQRTLAERVQAVHEQSDLSQQDQPYLEQLARFQADILRLVEQLESGTPTATAQEPVAPAPGDTPPGVDQQLDRQFFSPFGDAPESGDDG